ncbi:hemolysin-type calcium-binding repeat family protein, putative [Babesia ovis]|uniref:Hemolysin-type calcium-binding repeat family protein, putative n=1 Tax=Babesia ovis TaxID=5869 RepID=A0A9W5TBQ7_BABOV|nr:hemolysin-type calcium-binding repeat family protein, putative [Babesia ovis]
MEGFVANTKVNFDAEAQRANGMRKVTKWFLGIAAVAGATGGSVLAEKPTKHVDFHHLGGDEDIDDVPFESAAVIKPVAEIRNHGVDFLENGVGDEISFNPVDNFRNGYVETVDVGDEISFNPVDNFRNGYEETVDVGDEISFNPVDNFRNGYVETVDVGDEISFNPVDNFRNGYVETVDVGDEISFNPIENFRNGYVETVDVGDEISFNPIENFRNGYEEVVGGYMQIGKERYKKILNGIHEYFVENKSLHQYVPLLETVINSADINLPDAIYRLLGYVKPGDLDSTNSVFIAHRLAKLMVDVFIPERVANFKGRMARLDLMHLFFTLIMEAMTSKYN